MTGFFKSLGKFVSRAWAYLFLAWVGLFVGLALFAPKWKDVVTGGEFTFLPADVPSRTAEQLFASAFPDDLLASSMVIIVRRQEGLLEQDRVFIDEVLKPQIEKVAEEEGGLASEYVEPSASADGDSLNDESSAAEDDTADDAVATDAIVPPPPGPPANDPASLVNGTPAPESPADQAKNATAPATSAIQTDKVGDQKPPHSIISRVRTYTDKSMGRLLDSNDGKSSLVLIELTTEFLQETNHYTIEKIEKLIEVNGPLAREKSIPVGLELSVSGVAVVGRDLLHAAAQSASATDRWTFILVVFLLIAIYRSFGLAIIPLVTVWISVSTSLKLLSIMASWGWITPFHGMQIYISVVLYGAGVDYCLFLIARYIEELDQGQTMESAIANTIDKIGAALVASAGTVICGIGMMVFANFGKFQQAGIGIAFSLIVVMFAALTFTPTLLRLFGRWVFWPMMRTERVSSGGGGGLRAASPLRRFFDQFLHFSNWDKVGAILLQAPGRIWILCVLLMTPFAVYGLIHIENLSYGLLSELPETAPSVLGTKIVQQHFPAGATGPVTVLIEYDHSRENAVSFDEQEGIDAVASLTQRLRERMDELGLHDIRSVSHPLGGEEGMSGVPMLQRSVVRKRAIEFYVGGTKGAEGHVTRLDMIFKDDPFSRDSIHQLDRLQKTLQNILSTPLRAEESMTEAGAEEVSEGAEDDESSEQISVSPALDLPWVNPDDPEKSAARVHFFGATASISDLKVITDGDQVRIQILVLGGVFLILVILLKRPAISSYLIISVFFSYFVSLGATVLTFYLLDPQGFAGLDWKVPIFLFTILIAVGEDYNIFLMTRIEEEQREHGMVRGVVVALQKTGSIISSCGIIMAGTFSSLMAGTLLGMQQLGFALAFGVLLDTFVVRPILVPAYLILLYSGRLGFLGRLLGAKPAAETDEPTSISMKPDPSLPR
ncbi:MAG: MMPL family transporter [Planctomycetaceae bacterium]